MRWCIQRGCQYRHEMLYVGTVGTLISTGGASYDGTIGGGSARGASYDGGIGGGIGFTCWKPLIGGHGARRRRNGVPRAHL